MAVIAGGYMVEVTDIKERDLLKEIEEAEVAIEVAKAYERLLTNKDFETVILNGYIGSYREECINILMQPKSHNAITDEEALSKVDGVRSLIEYLGYGLDYGVITDKADMAKDIIKVNQQILANL